MALRMTSSLSRLNLAGPAQHPEPMEPCFARLRWSSYKSQPDKIIEVYWQLPLNWFVLNLSRWLQQPLEMLFTTGTLIPMNPQILVVQYLRPCNLRTFQIQLCSGSNIYHMQVSVFTQLESLVDRTDPLLPVQGDIYRPNAWSWPQPCQWGPQKSKP